MERNYVIVALYIVTMRQNVWGKLARRRGQHPSVSSAVSGIFDAVLNILRNNLDGFI